MRSFLLRRLLAVLSFVLLSAFAVHAHAADAAAPAAVEKTAPAPAAEETPSSKAWLAKAMSNEDEGTCSSSSTPCCCKLGSTATCTTADQCGDWGGSCVSSWAGCN